VIRREGDHSSRTERACYDRCKFIRYRIRCPPEHRSDDLRRGSAGCTRDESQAAVVDYCAAWNTTDRTERERLLARVRAPDGVYSDPEPTNAVGRAALSDAISTFHHSYPGAYFRCSVPQAHHGAMRVTWVLFRSDGSERLRGTDFSELTADGRIRRVVGFFGPPPEVRP
jgi:SnoaL-like domain